MGDKQSPLSLRRLEVPVIHASHPTRTPIPLPNLTVYGSKTLREVIASLVDSLKIPKFFPADDPNPMVYVRRFHPCLGEDTDYYLLDFDPQTGHCEAYVKGELGFVDIGELGKIRIGGLKFEVAKFFEPCRLSTIRGF